MPNIPRLTDGEIRTRVGADSFDGAQAGPRDSVFNLEVEESRLSGNCYGSYGQIHRLLVTFDGDAISDASCTCSVGESGYCKHMAALLLVWRDEPERFRETEGLETRLARCSKDQLIELLKTLLRYSPDLESYIDLRLTAKQNAEQRVADPEPFRSEAVVAIRSEGSDWNAIYAIVAKLERILEIGERYRNGGDPVTASTVYEGVCRAVLSDYQSHKDEDGLFGGLVRTCVEGLETCLAEMGSDEPARRSSALAVLSDVIRLDRATGGGDLADAAERAVRNHTS